MQENLVIVESPAKAKTIEKFLGEDFKVMSSYGHIRDLKKKELSIDKDTLQPDYVIPKDKEDLGPAESAGLTLRQSTGESLKPTMRSSTRRACCALTRFMSR